MKKIVMFFLLCTCGLLYGCKGHRGNCSHHKIKKSLESVVDNHKYNINQNIQGYSMYKVAMFVLLGISGIAYGCQNQISERINGKLDKKSGEVVKVDKDKTTREIDKEIMHILCQGGVEMGFDLTVNDDCPITPPDSPSEMK